MAEPTTEELKIVAQFLDSKKILIADDSSSVRTGLAKLFKELGSKNNLITLSQAYESALEDVMERAPEIVICDYYLGEHCGLKLVAPQKKLQPDNQLRLFMVVTANGKESSIAEAAEEEVDCYILKPFTISLFRDYLVRAVMAKMKPSPYRRALDEGKSLMQLGQYGDAAQTFLEATKLTPKPSLAFYYHGQSCFMEKLYDPAENSYNSGLRFSEYHYRCLTGLFELLLLRGRLTEAYQVSRKITLLYPISPQRLDEILRLAVKTRTFDDIEKYYEVYLNMDFRTPELTKCMNAALVVGGIYLLEHRKLEEALKLFEGAIISSSRNAGILREIIFSLTDRRYYREADKFLREFPPVAHNEPSYFILQFIVADGLNTDPMLIDRGRKMIEKGIYDQAVYKILIRRMIEGGLADGAENLIRDGERRWPEVGQELRSIQTKASQLPYARYSE